MGVSPSMHACGQLRVVSKFVSKPNPSLKYGVRMVPFHGENSGGAGRARTDDYQIMSPGLTR